MLEFAAEHVVQLKNKKCFVFFFFCRTQEYFHGNLPKHFCPQPRNLDSGEPFSMNFFVYIDG